MKKIFIFITILAMIFILSPTAYAESGGILKNEAASKLSDSLDEDAQSRLKEFGITSPDVDELSGLKIENVISAVFDMFTDEARAPLRAFASITGILLIFSVFEAFRDGLTTGTMKSVISAVIVLSVTFILVMPVTQLIQDASSAVSASAKFMLAYIPAMVGVLISCGNVMTSASYYTLMVFACQGIAQLCSTVITPLLNIFFGVSITSAVCPVFRLDGICKAINKTVKWILGFAMTVFSATLTFKMLITTVADSVSTRAVRFSLSSFIPIVGSSLAEAYKTVQSSVRLLKSGIGVFAIIAVAVVFLPILIRGLLWLISINLCKGAAHMLMLDTPCAVLEVSASVISTIIAIVLCIMAVFVISTTVLLMAGGLG